MAKAQINEYLPDYLTSPGEVLEDYLDAYGMTQAELALRTGLSKKTINEIIKGKSPITPETALKFERPLGRPAHFWNNLERQYQEDKVRLAEKERLESHLDWLNRFPVKDMIRLGWILESKDKLKLLEALLNFFGIASPEQWKDVWLQHQVAYRQTNRFEAHAEAISAWLRQGETQAREIDCQPFDSKKFRAALNNIRGLTRQAPEVFIPALVGLCASSGVAVVFVPELPKTGVFGATRWISGKGVIQLSLYYKSNDLFWFTFFHEAGHILKHGHKDIFIEYDGLIDEQEKEADAYARDKLIPPQQLRKFLERWDYRTHAPIEKFADQIGIARGIVVGRLQHDKLMPPTHGNKLKVFFRWSDTTPKTII
ncbi:HigA family addiction module antitoxin [Desulfatibacillum aliphaticivorans]|uniref:HigA family addiction module antitoxin n=1 Tax=Desulfatibacillum aliphaticivorans TaxID=218208 RepID=UPI0004002010|nr:HigA family addiction module antitoxin [Desulfatibacillum aliphaticivorans]